MKAAEARRTSIRYRLLVLLPVLLMLTVVPRAYARARVNETLTMPRADRRAHHVIADVRRLFDATAPAYHVDPCHRRSRRRASCAYALYLSDGRTLRSVLYLQLVKAHADQPSYVGWKITVNPLTEGVSGSDVLVAR